MGRTLRAGLFNDLLSVIFGQLLEALITIDRLLNSGDLVTGHVAGNIPALFPRLMVIEGALGSLAQD